MSIDTILERMVEILDLLKAPVSSRSFFNGVTGEYVYATDSAEEDRRRALVNEYNDLNCRLAAMSGVFVTEML